MYNTEKHTTLEESEMLLELGVDPYTASYQWHDETFSENEGEGTPVWGLWDLMELLPDDIQYMGKMYLLNTTSSGVDYYCFYDSQNSGIVFLSDEIKRNYFDAVVWLKEKGLRLKKEKCYKNDENGKFTRLLSLLDKR